MVNRNLLKETLSLIQLSSMAPKEKAMWMVLLPEMEEAHIKKLNKSLGEEVSKLNDLLLNTMK